jgi:flavodoxin
MKTLIITTSVHHGNTRKIADAMAETLGAEVVQPNKVTPEQLAMYDLVGFGSGIYFRKHHESIFRLLDRLPDMQGKKAFVFSTAGVRFMQKSFHRPLQERLRAKGFEVTGDFCCRGWDTYAIFGLIGGINRRHPDEKDIAAAKAFAEGLKKIR